MLSDLFKAFDYIASSHKLDFSVPELPSNICEMLDDFREPQIRS